MKAGYNENATKGQYDEATSKC